MLSKPGAGSREITDCGGGTLCQPLITGHQMFNPFMPVAAKNYLTILVISL